MTARLFLAACILGSSAACDGPGSAPDLRSLDDLPRIAAVEELRLGSLDDPDFGFSSIRGIEIVEGDTIYVGERSAGEIRVYSPGGELVRRIGRKGEGPGELGSFSRWGVRGDTVWVIEYGRATLFRRDGSLIRADQIVPFVVQEGPYRVTVRPQSLRPDGRLQGDLWSYGPVGDPGLPEMDIRVPLVVFDLDAGVVDTTGYQLLELGAPRGSCRDVGQFQSLICEAEYPFASPLEHASGVDTLRIERPIAEAGDVGVMRVLELSGTDTLSRRDYEYTPVPVPASYGDSIVEARVESYRRMANDPQALRSALEDLYDFAPFYPPVSRITVTPDGTAWLQRYSLSDDARWLVLRPDRSIRGQVALPSSVSILWSDGDRVYVEEKDAFDVPWIVRYRLEDRAR